MRFDVAAVDGKLVGNGAASAIFSKMRGQTRR
jgi:hypothetical protein